MRRAIALMFFLSLVAPICCAQSVPPAISDPVPHKLTKEEKAAQKAEEERLKKQRKEEGRRRKNEARAAQWAAEHPSPAALQPAYPHSLRPEFESAVRQTAAQLDVALKTAFEGSSAEFAMTHPLGQQMTAAVIAGSNSLGEQQVATALRAYGEMPSACRQATESAIRSLFMVGLIGQCREVAAFRRRVLELTFEQDK